MTLEHTAMLGIGGLPDDVLLKIFKLLLPDVTVAAVCRRFMSLFLDHGSLTVLQGAPVPVGLKKKLTVTSSQAEHGYSDCPYFHWHSIDRDAQAWLDTVIARVHPDCVIAWNGTPVSGRWSRERANRIVIKKLRMRLDFPGMDASQVTSVIYEQRVAVETIIEDITNRMPGVTTLRLIGPIADVSEEHRLLCFLRQRSPPIQAISLEAPVLCWPKFMCLPALRSFEVLDPEEPTDDTALDAGWVIPPSLRVVRIEGDNVISGGRVAMLRRLLEGARFDHIHVEVQNTWSFLEGVSSVEVRSMRFAWNCTSVRLGSVVDLRIRYPMVSGRLDATVLKSMPALQRLSMCVEDAYDGDATVGDIVRGPWPALQELTLVLESPEDEFDDSDVYDLEALCVLQLSALTLWSENLHPADSQRLSARDGHGVTVTIADDMPPF